MTFVDLYKFFNTRYELGNVYKRASGIGFWWMLLFMKRKLHIESS